MALRAAYQSGSSAAVPVDVARTVHALTSVRSRHNASHVLLDDPVDAGVQGKLGRGLDLRVDPAGVVRDPDDGLRP